MNKTLEAALVNAVVEAARELSVGKDVASFRIRVPNTRPPVWICAGRKEEIIGMLSSPTLADKAPD